MDEIVMVDVGAANGPHRRWSTIPDVRTVLFEPDTRAYEDLKRRISPAVHLLNDALFESRGELPFHLCRRQENSSLYEPNHELLAQYPDVERFEVVKTTQMRVDSLDSVHGEARMPHPQFIKLDAQGAELPILRGGIGLLAGVVGIEVECEYKSLYVDQPLFPDVDAFLRSQEFEPLDFVNYHWKRKLPGARPDSSLGDLMFADALYFRSPERIVDMVEAGAVTMDQALRCYLAYGYTHLGSVLIELARARLPLDAVAYERLRTMVAGFRRSTGLSFLPKSSGVRGRLRRLTERLFPATGWATTSKASLGS